MTIGPFLDALLACDLPPAELAAQIKAELPAAAAAKLEKLIAIAPAEKLGPVITAYLSGLVKEEKADAKRKRDRENIATKRAGGDTATRATSATPRHRDSPRTYTSPPREISEPKKVLKSISTHPLPADFKLTPNDVAFAVAKKGWDQQRIDHEFCRFEAHYRGNGKLFADWRFVWRSWVTNPLTEQQGAFPLPPPLHVVGGNEHERLHRQSHSQDRRPGGLARLQMHLGSGHDPQSDFGT